MKRITRRGFIQTAAAAPIILINNSAAAGIRIENVEFNYEEFRYRAPYKFGGVPVDRATILNVNVIVRNTSGRTAKGFGSMPLGNVWSFPSREMSYDTTLNAMKALTEVIAKITANYKEYGHPIDLNTALEPEYLKAAAEVSNKLKLLSPIPKLCTLVTASPFDAAIHDAFGKIH